MAGFLAQGSRSYDAILLEVDNGPEGLIREENGRLYSGSGAQAARAALRPGGVLAVRSAALTRVISED